MDLGICAGFPHDSRDGGATSSNVANRASERNLYLRID